MDSKINVMGLEIDHITYQTLKKKTSENLISDRLSVYVFLSTKLIEYAAEDEALKESLAEAEYLLPGYEQVYGTQAQTLAKKNMVMAYHTLLEVASRMDHTHTVYLLAAQDSDITRITTYVKSNFHKLKIIGTYASQDEWTDEQLLNSINSANPDIIVNTIDYPVEGKWVAEYGQQISAKLYIGLGAIFTTMVSELKDPPVLIQKLHLLSLYHKIRGYRKHKSLHLRIFRRKVEQYNTKKGDNENGTTY